MGMVLAARTLVPDFVIGVIPDPQYEVSNNPTVWTSLCDWFAAQKDALNVKAVLTVGDNVNSSNQSTEWSRASAGGATIEAAGIPYVPAIGNHDYDGDEVDRVATSFDANFGPNRFTGKSYYGGCYNNSHTNYYVKLDISYVKLLILVLELFPTAAAVAWAAGIIDANTDRQAIILTHSYLTKGGNQTADNSAYGIDTYGFSHDDYNGQELWAALVAPKATVIAVVSGHDISTPLTAHRSDNNKAGKSIIQTFQNYQAEANGGDGWIGLMQFSQADQQIHFTYYRTYEPSGLGYDEAKAFDADWVS